MNVSNRCRRPAIEILERRMLLAAAGTGTIAGQVFEVPTFMSPPVAPLAGWEVYLDLNRSGHLAPRDPTAVTDSLGDYAFANLRAGNYRVAAVFPPGWVPALGGKGWTNAAVQAGRTTEPVNLAAAPVLANATASLLAARPATLRAGSAGQVTLRLANAGDSSPVSGRFDITLIASTTASPANGTTVASITRAIRVPANAARNLLLTFRLPRTLPAGVYSLFATILPHGAAESGAITTPASAPLSVTASLRFVAG